MIGTLGLFGALAYVAYYIFFKKDPPPKFGVYAQPGKWFSLKYYTFLLLLKLRERQRARKGAGFGKEGKLSATDMERPQKLDPTKPRAVDAVFFNGSNNDGIYFIAAAARRPKEITQTVLIIRIPGYGTLELPSSPHTDNKATDLNAFAAAGLRIDPVEPMKTWKITFSGPLKLNQGQLGTKEVKVNLEWTAHSNFFDFDTDMEPHALARSMAREPWDKPFFQRLQDAHQTHHEQFGNLQGTIEIEGEEKKEVWLRGVRDHSYGGVRDWHHIYRYTIHYLHFKDQSCMCLGIVSMPGVLMSRLEFGYVFSPSGRLQKMERSEMPIEELGEDGNPPKTFSFSLHTAGPEVRCYKVEINVEDRVDFFYEDDWAGQICEMMVTANCNGVPGRGFAEWQYRNDKGPQLPSYIIMP